LASGILEQLVTGSCGRGGDGGSAGPVPPARAIETRDIAAGLRVVALCPANVWHMRDGLLDLLGAGWDHCKVPHLPFALRWPVACIFSRPQDVQDADVLAIWIVVKDPNGIVIEKESLLLFGQANSTTQSLGTSIDFTASVAGTWRLSVCSGKLCLAETPIEILCA
jgi:hypothetical protein